MYSWSSTILKIGGQTFHGIKAIDYGDKRERVKAYGMGRNYGPMGRTGGKYTPDPVKLTVFKSSVTQLKALFMDPTLSLNLEQEIILQYVEFGTELPMTIEFTRCVIASQHTGLEESPDPTVEEIELDTMGITENGVSLYDRTGGVL
jgi:hypothetical protein